MPNENPPPPSFFAEFETVIQTLSLYGAAGIAAFGWAMGWFLGIEAAPWLPLWFCAALLIYNVDRLRIDPADRLNIPRRAAACARWRGVIRGTVVLAALGLIGLPVWRRDWFTLELVVAGSIICLGYSLPVFGWRWKDVPLVKSLFAPAIVTAAIFGLLLLGETPHRPDAFALLGSVTFLVPWAFGFLLFNMLLCDLRDRAGDAQCGIRSVPVVLGERDARRLLWALAIGGQLLLAILIRFRPDGQVLFGLLALVTGLYQAWLLHATRRPRGERFYEWAVEGMLYLPALACGFAFLFHRLAPYEV